MNYLSILNQVNNFLSLDISVRSTGYCIKRGNDIQVGTVDVSGGELVERRAKFRAFLIDLMGDTEFDYVFVEDTIMGVNYNTTRNLILLNSIIDDLKYEGLVKCNEIVRVDNKRWKKFLREVTNYKSKIRGSDDKEEIRSMLNMMGFMPEEGTAQDIYDAVGIAVGVINNIKNPSAIGSTNHKLKEDLRKGYTFVECKPSELEEVAEDKSKVYGVDILEVNAMDSSNLCNLFKKIVRGRVDDDFIFKITAPLNSCGELAILGLISCDNEVVNMVVYKKSLKKLKKA